MAKRRIYGSIKLDEAEANLIHRAHGVALANIKERRGKATDEAEARYYDDVLARFEDERSALDQLVSKGVLKPTGFTESELRLLSGRLSNDLRSSIRPLGSAAPLSSGQRSDLELIDGLLKKLGKPFLNDSSQDAEEADEEDEDETADYSSAPQGR